MGIFSRAGESRNVPVRNSQDFHTNGGDSEWWPSGRSDAPTGSKGNMTWMAGPGQGLAVGGRHGLWGYGWGPTGPNGPNYPGNLPGPLPPGLWWNNIQTGEGGSWPAAFTRCASIVVGGVLGTPLEVRRGDDSDPLPLPLWYTNPMRTDPVAGVPPENLSVWGTPVQRNHLEFWSTVLTNAILYGRGAWSYQVGPDNQPVAGSLHLENIWSMFVDRGEDGQAPDTQARWVLNGETENPTYCRPDGTFTKNGLTHKLVVMRGMPPYNEYDSDWWGGVIPRHSGLVSLAQRLESFTTSGFDSPVPAGILKVSTPSGFTQEAADGLRAAWQKAHGDGSRGVAVLNSATDFQPIQRPKIVDMDMPHVYKMVVANIAHAFRMSSVWLDSSVDAITYTNRVDARTDLSQQTLKPAGAMFTQMLNTVLPAGSSATFKWSRFIAPNQEVIAATWLPVLQAGAITVDEFRQKMDMPPLTGQQDVEQKDGGN